MVHRAQSAPQLDNWAAQTSTSFVRWGLSFRFAAAHLCHSAVATAGIGKMLVHGTFAHKM